MAKCRSLMHAHSMRQPRPTRRVLHQSVPADGVLARVDSTCFPILPGTMYSVGPGPRSLGGRFTVSGDCVERMGDSGAMRWLFFARRPCRDIMERVVSAEQSCRRRASSRHASRPRDAAARKASDRYAHASACASSSCTYPRRDHRRTRISSHTGDAGRDIVNSSDGTTTLAMAKILPAARLTRYQRTSTVMMVDVTISIYMLHIDSIVMIA